MDVSYQALPRYEAHRWAELKYRLAPLRRKFVPSAAADEIAEKMSMLLANRALNLNVPETEMKMGLAIYGESGSGKSKLINRRVRNTLPEPSVDARRPFVSFRLDAPARLKTAGFQLTKELLGEPGLTYNDKAPYWALLKDRLSDHGTLCVHMDEAQDLFLTATYKDAAAVRGAFKAVMTYTECPTILVLTATPLLKLHLEPDIQVARRFYHVTLPPFSLVQDLETLIDAIESHCAELGIENGLVKEDYRRLVHAAANQYGMTIARALDGLQEAFAAGDRRLTTLHMAYAFERDTGFSPSLNPFLVANWETLPFYQSVAPLEPPPKRRPPKNDPWRGDNIGADT